MTLIHYNKLNNIAVINLLHDILNPPKCTKNCHYYPILHGCMNTRKGKVNFESFRIIFDSGCVSTTVMGILFGKLNPKKYDVMQLHTQAGNINNTINI